MFRSSLKPVSCFDNLRGNTTIISYEKIGTF